MSQRWKLLDTEKSIASRECWKKNSRQQNVITPVCQPGVPSMMRCFVNGTTQKKKPPAQFSPGIHNLTISEVSFNNSWQPRNQYIFSGSWESLTKKHRIHCGFLAARHLFVCHCYTCQYTCQTLVRRFEAASATQTTYCIDWWVADVFLIGGFKHDWIMFHFIYGIIPTPLTFIFFKMVIAPPTRFLRRTLLYPGDLRCPWQGCRNPTRARAPWPVPGYPGYLGNPTE